MSGLRPRSWAAMLLALVSVTMTAASPATASVQIQALPSPLRFVSFVDLECFKTSPYTPPAVAIFTRHINPVLANLPAETVTLGPREQLCVPVVKNGNTPPADVLAFVRFVDLSCYRITGINVNQPLNLRQLNPVLANIPPRNIVMTTPQQLCVPVIKNGVVPPPEVKSLVAFIDLKCYLEQPQAALNRPLTLSQLNPVLANIPVHNVTMTFNRQLCVPVQKNNQAYPAGVFNIVRWLDLEKFDIVTTSALPTITLTLNHINPALSGLPAETATLLGPNQLGVPVAKNNVIPPA